MAVGLLFEEVSPTDSLLITGPAMTGKYELMHHLLAAKTDGVLFITLKNNAETILGDFENYLSDEPATVGVIDVSESSGDKNTINGHPVWHVNSPSNLTQIGVKFTEAHAEFLNDPDIEQLGVGFHSLTQLVWQAEFKKVYQFVQVLTGQVRSSGCFGVSVLDTIESDNQYRVLQHHFDGAVHTRTSESGREYRIRGLTPKRTDWHPF